MHKPSSSPSPVNRFWPHRTIELLIRRLKTHPDRCRTGAGDADDALTGGVQPVHEIDHRAHRRLVVPIVEDHPEAVLVEDVHPPRALEKGVVEGPEPRADLVERGITDPFTQPITL